MRQRDIRQLDIEAVTIEVLVGPISQNLSSLMIDSFCYTLVKSLFLIGYQQICH